MQALQLHLPVQTPSRTQLPTRGPLDRQALVKWILSSPEGLLQHSDFDDPLIHLAQAPGVHRIPSS